MSEREALHRIACGLHAVAGRRPLSDAERRVFLAGRRRAIRR